MIRIEQLSLQAGSFALRGVDLHVAQGEYFVLLGPTGSGKTLLAECLCGLNRAGSGHIFVAGVDITRLEPRHRGIGYLPQDYALFPHLSVRSNIAYGLRCQELSAEARASRVASVLGQLRIEPLALRRPAHLSGGEKQRVALARALAIRPAVLVLDEPLSALDEATRNDLCRELRRLQRANGTTVLHVCHSFDEMLAVADRVGVVDDGRIVQVGAPADVLERPQTARVARFMQAGNLFPARVRRDGDWLRLSCGGGIELVARAEVAVAEDQEVFAMVRPEHVELRRPSTDAPPLGASRLAGVVSDILDRGPLVRVAVGCGDAAEILVTLGKRRYNEMQIAAGDRIELHIESKQVHVMAS